MDKVYAESLEELYKLIEFWLFSDNYGLKQQIWNQWVGFELRLNNGLETFQKYLAQPQEIHLVNNINNNPWVFKDYMKSEEKNLSASCLSVLLVQDHQYTLSR